MELETQAADLQEKLAAKFSEAIAPAVEEAVAPTIINAKEAASKGEEARFINSFVNFLANNGVQTTITAIENIFKKQAAKPTT